VDADTARRDRPRGGSRDGIQPQRLRRAALGRAGQERRGVNLQALRAGGAAREDEQIPRLVPRAAPATAGLSGAAPLGAMSAQCPDYPKAAIRYRYSITSSARANSVGGTSRPSALAVARLMTRSNLVGCCTPRIDGHCHTDTPATAQRG